MSLSNLEMKWINFVKSLRNIGVLLLFVMIPYLAFVIIPIQFILIMIAVRDVYNMNQELNNAFLDNFRKKYLTASIVKFIGSMILHIGSAMLATFLVFGPMMPHMYIGPFSVGLMPPIITLLIIGFVIMIVGSSVEMGAWDNLKLFIQENKDVFPDRIFKDTITGVENLRSGALMWALGFLIVPIIIGWIFQLIGYFGLSNVAKWGMKFEPITPITQDLKPVSPPTQETQPIPTSTQEPQLVEDIKFCPMCGAKVEEGAKFCGECGIKLGS